MNKDKGLSFDSYDDLWTWSVTDLDNFWTCIWEYFHILHDGTPTNVVQGSMPACTWFEGTSLNYAEHIFRKTTGEYPAIIFKSESSPLQEISWASLTQQVASLQQHFKAQGIQAGDRIVAYMPACPKPRLPSWRQMPSAPCGPVARPTSERTQS